MAFEFAAKGKIWWPIYIARPTEDGTGQVEYITCKLQFSQMTRKEQKDVIENLGDDEAGERIKAHVHDWDVKDEKGDPVPFNPKNLAAALDLPPFASAAIKGLLEVSDGTAARKNL